MYADWASLQDEIQCDRGNQSVLHRFPAAVGREVACSVVKCIAHNLSSAATNDEPSSLEDERDVKWTMEVLCFGLGLPLSEHETINDCVKVYVEWLMSLTQPKPCVPKPVTKDPNPFAQVILHHLLNLFKPRPDSGVDLVKRQALLCHRVLRAIEAVAKESSILTRDTWETLLKFLLAANDSLLSPPMEKDDSGLSSCIVLDIDVESSTWRVRLFLSNARRPGHFVYPQVPDIQTMPWDMIVNSSVDLAPISKSYEE